MINVPQPTEWEKIRVKGRARYVLTDGVLKVGMGIALVRVLINYWWDHGLGLAGLGDFLFTSEAVFEFFWTSIWYGLIFGFIGWYSNEKRFKKTARQSTIP